MIYEYFQKYQKERNIFLPLSEILERAKGKTDVYCSIFGYNSDDLYNGKIYGPLYFDLDSENLEHAYSDTHTLLEILKFYNLRKNDYQLSFSGSKGFHLIVYPQVFAIEPAGDLDKVYKQIATWFVNELAHNSIDLKVYERRRPWRIINTINGKSGLYKIPIGDNDSLEEVLKKAKTEQPIIKKNPRKNPALSSWIERARAEIKEKSQRKQRQVFTSDKSIAPQVLDLINSGVAVGERNQTAFYIACYLKSKNFDEIETEGHLETFANNCPSSPPFTEREVQSVIKSAYRNSI